MKIRNLILHNLGWKVTAFVAALMVWFSVSYIIENQMYLTRRNSGTTLVTPPSGLATDQWFLSIQAVRSPDDPRIFNLEPAEVSLTLEAAADVLQNLGQGDIQVFVNVSDLQTDAPAVQRPVQVVVPSGVSVVDLNPENVRARARSATAP